MAKGKNIKFISFDKKDSHSIVNQLDNQEMSKVIISKLSLSISIESAKLLEITSKEDYDIKDAMALAKSIQKNVNALNEECDKFKPEVKPIITIFSGTTSLENYIQKNDVNYFSQERVLDNGGMAPPTNSWQSISNLKLNSLDKYSLIQEMRKLNLQGKTLTKSNFHEKVYLSIKEFTEPFKYLENVKDYSGSFLVSLIKDEIEFDSAASVFKIDLNEEKAKCLSGDLSALSVYDIAGSSSVEEKKFLLLLSFDKLNGVLKLDSSIFMEGQDKKFSERQVREIEKFCKIKKVVI